MIIEAKFLFFLAEVLLKAEHFLFQRDALFSLSQAIKILSFKEHIIKLMRRIKMSQRLRLMDILVL